MSNTVRAAEIEIAEVIRKHGLSRIEAVMACGDAVTAECPDTTPTRQAPRPGTREYDEAFEGHG